MGYGGVLGTMLSFSQHKYFSSDQTLEMFFMSILLCIVWVRLAVILSEPKDEVAVWKRALIGAAKLCIAFGCGISLSGLVLNFDMAFANLVACVLVFILFRRFPSVRVIGWFHKSNKVKPSKEVIEDKEMLGNLDRNAIISKESPSLPESKRTLLQLMQQSYKRIITALLCVCGVLTILLVILAAIWEDRYDHRLVKHNDFKIWILNDHKYYSQYDYYFPAISKSHFEGLRDDFFENGNFYFTFDQSWRISNTLGKPITRNGDNCLQLHINPCFFYGDTKIYRAYYAYFIYAYDTKNTNFKKQSGLEYLEYIQGFLGGQIHTEGYKNNPQNPYLEIRGNKALNEEVHVCNENGEVLLVNKYGYIRQIIYNEGFAYDVYTIYLHDLIPSSRYIPILYFKNPNNVWIRNCALTCLLIELIILLFVMGWIFKHNTTLVVNKHAYRFAKYLLSITIIEYILIAIALFLHFLDIERIHDEEYAISLMLFALSAFANLPIFTFVSRKIQSEYRYDYLVPDRYLPITKKYFKNMAIMRLFMVLFVYPIFYISTLPFGIITYVYILPIALLILLYVLVKWIYAGKDIPNE